MPSGSRPGPFGAGSLRGASASPNGATGPVIDYGLARRSVINEYRRGRLAQHEVCDAHPELLRAARNVGEATGRSCPICEEDELVLVSYAFGTRLPSHGRCITERSELVKLGKRVADLTYYVVEVCPACAWNHLARTFFLGRQASG